MTTDAAAHINKHFVEIMVITSLAIVFSALTIFGAMRYDSYLLMYPIVYHIVYLCILLSAVVPLSGIKKDPDGGLENERAGNQYDLMWVFIVFPIVIFVMMLYSNYVFYKEIKNGIMSPVTYEREKVACCC